jgi:hypothetical protein
MLIVSSWSERFRSDIGFNGVSQIWNDRLSWYFWLANAPGVYQLEIMNTDEDRDTHGDRRTAVFKVKCYPYQERPEFQSFSFFERKLVQSKLFDQTNTPSFEHQDDISEDLFTVATIEISLDLKGQTTNFSFESMVSLRTRFTQKTHHTFPTIDLERTFEKHEIDRDVPGLAMGYPLFDCLMCLYANTHKQPPLDIRCWMSPGYEALIEGDHVHARETSDINGFKLDLLFSAKGLASHGIGGQVLEDPHGALDDLIYNRSFTCGNYHESKSEEKLPVMLNPQWWWLSKKHYQSELSTSCGCH